MCVCADPPLLLAAGFGFLSGEKLNRFSANLFKFRDFGRLLASLLCCSFGASFSFKDNFDPPPDSTAK